MVWSVPTLLPSPRTYCRPLPLAPNVRETRFVFYRAEQTNTRAFTEPSRRTRGHAALRF